MKRLLVVAVMGLLASCAAKPPPEVVPPPAAPVDPVPVRAPTLAIETRYSPDLTLTLRLDGVPYAGEARLAALGPGGFEGSPGDPVTDVSDRALDMRRVETGVFVADAALLGAMGDARGFELIVDGRRYPYPHASGTSPAMCSAGLSAARKIDPCRERRPTAEMVPAACDDAGAAGFRALVASLDSQVDTCWANLDDRTLSALGSLRDGSLVQEACVRLSKIAGPDVPTPVGARLMPACEHHFAAETAKRLMLARRTEDFPAAFERAKRLSSAEMHQFVIEYGITGDPRLADIRKLAMDRFGPKDRPAFFRAMKALSSVHVEGWGVKLCDLDGNRAQVAFVRSPRASLDEDGESRHAFEDDEGIGASRTCVRVRKMVMRRPPEALIARSTAVVKATTKARDVSWSWGCSTDHWYLDEEPIKKR